MARKEFWIFYGTCVTGAFVAITTLTLLASIIPGTSGVVLDLGMLIVMLATFVAIFSGMVRRIRDAGLHWSVVVLAIISLFVAAFAFVIETTTYTLNMHNGTLDAWLAQRFPFFEISSLLFVGFSIALFWGLTRPGPARPKP